MPQLLACSTSAVVLCYESAAAGDDGVIEVRFDGYASVRMGHPNDEVLQGHPLYQRGLKFYAAHIVHGSPWLEEHRRINSVHPSHSNEKWAGLSHYLLAFHDEVIEVLARHVVARRVTGDLPSELLRVASEMGTGI